MEKKYTPDEILDLINDLSEDETKGLPQYPKSEARQAVLLLFVYISAYIKIIESVYTLAGGDAEIEAFGDMLTMNGKLLAVHINYELALEKFNR